jgi:hypothetical protein
LDEKKSVTLIAWGNLNNTMASRLEGKKDCRTNAGHNQTKVKISFFAVQFQHPKQYSSSFLIRILTKQSNFSSYSYYVFPLL